MIAEDDVRKKVKALRALYRDVINFIVMSVVLIFIWLIFDKNGNFWPKYVILFWGIGLALMAMSKGLFPLIFHRLSFFDERWEERKVKELSRRLQIHHKPPEDESDKKKK